MYVCLYAHGALEVHQPLATCCYDGHGLDPVFCWIRIAVGDYLTSNLKWEDNWHKLKQGTETHTITYHHIPSHTTVVYQVDLAFCANLEVQLISKLAQ